jgi:carbamoylphosphate synthase large subunit
VKFFLITLVLCSQAFASETLIHEMSTRFHNGQTFGEFRVNESTGQAWVEIAMEGFTPDVLGATENVEVAGLSLDGESVMMDSVECAVLRTVGIFKKRKVIETGKCSIDFRISGRTLQTYLITE